MLENSLNHKLVCVYITKERESNTHDMYYTKKLF